MAGSEIRSEPASTLVKKLSTEIRLCLCVAALSAPDFWLTRESTGAI